MFQPDFPKSLASDVAPEKRLLVFKVRPKTFPDLLLGSSLPKRFGFAFPSDFTAKIFDALGVDSKTIFFPESPKIFEADF